MTTTKQPLTQRSRFNNYEKISGYFASTAKSFESGIRSHNAYVKIYGNQRYKSIVFLLKI